MGKSKLSWFRSKKYSPALPNIASGEWLPGMIDLRTVATRKPEPSNGCNLHIVHHVGV